MYILYYFSISFKQIHKKYHTFVSTSCLFQFSKFIPKKKKTSKRPDNGPVASLQGHSSLGSTWKWEAQLALGETKMLHKAGIFTPRKTNMTVENHYF